MLAPRQSAIRDLEDFLKLDYDYLVVGGGTAGLAIATRLSETANVHVGVIEAGAAHIDDPALLTPAAFATIIEDPDYDWGLKTVPQAGTHSICHSFPRGKALGGSSAINYMQYVRGQRQEYDDWSRLTGYPSWDWEHLRPYYLKHEAFHGPASSRDDPHYHDDEQVYYHSKPELHGTSGPIKTSFPTWGAPVERDWHRAARQQGSEISVPADAWSGANLGIYSNLSTIDRSKGSGTRSYATTGYFLPSADRPNLSVLVEAQVARIAFDRRRAENDSIRATGVYVVANGTEHFVKASREVILSAGVVHTPQLLELSGIGQRELLKLHDIDCIIANEQVGEGLEDHVCTSVVYEVKQDVFTNDWMSKPEVAQKAMADYQNGKGGILANPVGNNAFVPLVKVASDDEVAAVTAAVAANGSDNPVVMAQRQVLRKRITDPMAASFQMAMLAGGVNPSKQAAQKEVFMTGVNAVSVMVVTTHPFSRGSIHIQSGSIHDAPSIDPQYLQHPADATILAAGCRFADSILNTSPLKEQLARRIFPSPEVDMEDVEAVKRYVHRHALTSYHPIGTAALGQVVDEKLKVFGTSNLRVADASIFPVHISGNIVGTVYAIAEKAADLIKQDAGLARS